MGHRRCSLSPAGWPSGWPRGGPEPAELGSVASGKSTLPFLFSKMRRGPSPEVLGIGGASGPPRRLVKQISGLQSHGGLGGAREWALLTVARETPRSEDRLENLGVLPARLPGHGNASEPSPSCASPCCSGKGPFREPGPAGEGTGQGGSGHIGIWKQPCPCRHPQETPSGRWQGPQGSVRGKAGPSLPRWQCPLWSFSSALSGPFGRAAPVGRVLACGADGLATPARLPAQQGPVPL